LDILTWVVVILLLCGFYGVESSVWHVAMWLLYLVWLLYMVFLGCSEWLLPDQCYMVAKVF